MKRQLLSVLLLTATMTALPLTARAASLSPGEDIHKTRLQNMDSRDKSIENIHKTRLQNMNSRDKSIENIQKTRLAQLNEQSKNSADSKGERLEQISNRTIADTQQVRLEHLDTRSKSVSQ